MFIYSSLVKSNATAIQCFDISGLPLMTVGHCDKKASNVLCSVYRHVCMAVEPYGECDPVVVIERENR